MAWPHLPNLGKERLQATFAQLDPIELIRNIRCVQEELAMVNNNELDQLKSESAESFLRKLRTVWHEGEVRPTHRRQAARHWRTRPDPFETVRSRIQEQLSLTPYMGAKELFQQLRKEYLASSLRIKSGLCGAELGSGERTWRSALSSVQAMHNQN